MFRPHQFSHFFLIDVLESRPTLYPHIVLVDVSLKCLIIYRFPFPLFFSSSVCWWNHVIYPVNSHIWGFANCIPWCRSPCASNPAFSENQSLDWVAWLSSGLIFWGRNTVEAVLLSPHISGSMWNLVVSLWWSLLSVLKESSDSGSHWPRSGPLPVPGWACRACVTQMLPVFKELMALLEQRRLIMELRR